MQMEDERNSHDGSHKEDNMGTNFQLYVNALAFGGTKATIASLDGTSLATSPGFSPTSAELKAIAALFGNPDLALASGLTVAGVQYIGLRADESVIEGKTSDGGCACANAGQVIVVAIFDQAHASLATQYARGLALLFRSQGAQS